MSAADSVEDVPLGTRALRGSSVLLLRLVAVYGATAVGSIVLTKLFTPADFGTFSIVYNLSLLVYAVATMGLTQLLVREQIRDWVLLDAAFWSIVAVTSAVAVVAVAAVVLLDLSNRVSWLLAGLVLFVVLTPLRFPALVVSLRDLRVWPQAVVEVGETLTFEVVTISAALLGAGVRSFAYGLMVAAVVAALLSIGFQRRLPTRPRLRPIRPWLRPLLPVQAVVTLSLVRDSLTFTLLVAVTSTTAVGLYSWAYSVATLPALLAAIAFGPLFTAFTKLRDRREEFDEAVTRGVRVVLGGTIALGAVICAATEPIITVVFSPAWLPARWTVWILVVGAVFYVAATLLMQVAGVRGAGAAAASRWQLASLVVYWGVGLPAARLGIEAFAAAYVLSTILFAGLAYRFVGARHGLRLRRTVLVCAAAGAAGAGLGAAAASRLGSSFLSILVAAAIAAGVYLAAVLVLDRHGLADDARMALRLIRVRAAAAS